MNRIAAAGAALFFILLPGAAAAHSVVQGVDGFYAGLLHPLVVPAELLALVAAGLLIGRSGLAVCRRGIPTLAGGVVAGLVLASVVTADTDATTLLIVAALAAAAIVISGLRAPIWLGAGLAGFAGIAVGFDAAPETNPHSVAFLTGAATLLGATAFVTIIAALALRAEKHWQRVAAQVAGSWIAASAILYLAYQLVAPTR